MGEGYSDYQLVHAIFVLPQLVIESCRVATLEQDEIYRASTVESKRSKKWDKNAQLQIGRG